MEEIEALIKDNKSFVIYRAPNQEPVFILQSSGKLLSLDNPEELNEKTGFVFAPFRVNASSPLMLMRPDVTVKGWKKITEYFSSVRSNETLDKATSASVSKESRSVCCGNNYDSYFRAFSFFIKSLREKTFDKLVLSRTKICPKEDSFSAGTVFYNACNHYPDAFVYLYHTMQTGTWLGSTPEILLSGEGDSWHTVALAGTLPFHKVETSGEWSEKNIREQQLVAGYIRNQLAAFGVSSNEEGPYTVRAGELAHLKSDFSFVLKAKDKIGSLLALLHPTPAVCGLPKEEAYRFILDNEGYDRRYYSGFMGWLDPSEKTDLYVNLRCMEIQSAQLILYAGGGLLSDSEPDSEWRETESKLQTMLAVIK